MKALQLGFLFFLLYSCSEHKEGRPLLNNLPEEGPALRWRQETTFDNIPELEKGLSTEQAATFSRSLGWIGTDSEIDLKKLDGKNAKEIVKIANCLKTQELPDSDSCL